MFKTKLLSSLVLVLFCLSGPAWAEQDGEAQPAGTDQPAESQSDPKPEDKDKDKPDSPADPQPAKKPEPASDSPPAEKSQVDPGSQPDKKIAPMPDQPWHSTGGQPLVKPLKRIEPTPAMKAAPVAPQPEPAPAPPAQVPAEPTEIYGRHLALGVSTLKELGMIAAQLRLRYDHVALEGAFGLLPILIFVTGDDFGVVADYSLHATGSLLIFFNSDQSRLSHGMRLGGIWDDKFSWGGLIGWQGEFRLSQLLSVSFGAGFQVYPWANDWAEDKVKAKYPGYAVDIDTQTIVQVYLGVGILLYLF